MDITNQNVSSPDLDGGPDIRVEFEEAKRRLSTLGEQATAYIKENPGKCVMGALALGYLIGKIARR